MRSATLPFIAMTLSAACSDRSAAPTAPVPVPSPPAVVAAPTPAPSPATPPLAPPTGPWPAFVVQTFDLDDEVWGAAETLLVPVHPTSSSEPAPHGAGIWLLGGDEIVRGQPRLHTEELAIPSEMLCPRDAAARRLRVCDARRTGVFLLHEGLDGSTAGRGECDCYRRGPRSAEDDCGYSDKDFGIVSIVGGAVYSGWSTEGRCEGGAFMSMMLIDETAVFPRARTLSFQGTARCLPGSAVTEDGWSIDAAPCAVGSDDDGCLLCDRTGDVRMIGLRRGQLVELAVAGTDDGARSSFVRTSPATPSSCPSDEDPCGSPSGFPGLTEQERFWVANDGSVALAQNGQRLELRVPGRAEPTWRSAIPGWVIGVQLVADARALRARLTGTAAAAPTTATSAAPAGDDMVPVAGAITPAGPGGAPPVAIAPFQIDRTEVTIERFARCVAAGACESPGSACAANARATKKPVACVSWQQAAALCSFEGRRLPTESEWELAARGTDGRLYPWGNEPPDCTRADFTPTGSSRDSCDGEGSSPVGTHTAGASPSGALDMAGNVWEWVDGSSGDMRVTRGGTWGSPASELASTMRRPLAPETQRAGIGFRCARTP
jgi:formylglycine-generating enzyme required for sulfatase activity